MKLFVICLGLILKTSILTAVSLQCWYEMTDAGYESTKTYFCVVTGTFNVLEPHTKVSSPSGTHLSGYTTKSVEGFRVDSSFRVHYFPQRLDIIFENLKRIRMEGVGLKEIHQTDLKPFTELEYLNLYGNKIEYIEMELFKYNTKLKCMTLSSNSILYVDRTAFDNLNSLNLFYINNNKCVTGDASDRQSILNLIQKSINQCNFSLKYFLSLLHETLDEKSSKLILSIQNDTKISLQNESLKIKNETHNLMEKLTMVEDKLRNTSSRGEVNNQELKQEILSFKNHFDAFLIQYQNQSSVQEQFKQNLLKKEKDIKEESQLLKAEINNVKKNSETILKNLHKQNDENQLMKAEIVSIKNDFESFISNQSSPTPVDPLSVRNVSLFIAIPLVCLLTILNVGLVSACFWRKICTQIETNEVCDMKEENKDRERIELRQLSEEVDYAEIPVGASRH